MPLKFHILYSNPVSYVHTNIVIFCSHTTSRQIVFVSAEMPVFWIATETNSSVHRLHTDPSATTLQPQESHQAT